MNTHIIEKQVVELSLWEAESYHPVASAFYDVMHDRVFPKLASEMDKLSNANTIIAIDRLDIDLGLIRWHRDQDKIADRIVELVIEKIAFLIWAKDDNVNLSGIEVVPVAIQHWTVWRRYLETGVMDATGTSCRELKRWEFQLLETMDLDSYSEIRFSIQSVIRNKKARERLLVIFSIPFIKSLIAASYGTREVDHALFSFAHRIANSFPAPRETFEKVVCEIVLDQPYADPATLFLSFLERIIQLYPNSHWSTILLTVAEYFTSSQADARTPLLEIIRKYPVTILHSEKVFNLLRELKGTVPNRMLIDAFTAAVSRMENKKTMLVDAFSAALSGMENKKTKEGPDQEHIPFNSAQPVSKLVADHASENDAVLEVNRISAIYVRHAGLVIAIPFLPQFFEETRLVVEGEFENEQAQMMAVRLTGFLASGQADIPDWELTLPKIVCGFPHDKTLPTDLCPDVKLLEEATELLNAIIRHWGVLGDSSPDGLREGFLQRSGKLTAEGDDWLLQVEASTIDVLMEKLPWGFGMIKLPWMKGMLKTEWHCCV